MRILICLLLAVASSVEAGVFRCHEIRDGAITYQNRPCPGGTFQRQFRVDVPPPPDFFAVPESVEIVARSPVRVVPLAAGYDAFDDTARR